MVDIAPAGFDPLLSFKKSEWEAYQQYVAGLETQLAAHKEAAELRAANDAKREAEAIAESQRQAEADVVLVEKGPPVSMGDKTLYVLGWSFFSSMILPGFAWIGVITLGALAQTNWLGLIVGLMLLSILTLAVMIQWRLQKKRHPVGVFLYGVIAPTIPWIVVLANFRI